jgi:hypothetical protein
MKYFSKKKINERDEILLYFMSILALIQIFYLVMHKKYTFIILFFIIGVVLNFFMKNQSIILIIDIILINILLNVKRHEGLESKMPVTASSTTTPTTPTTEPNTKNTANKKSSSGVSKNASAVTEPTTLDSKENFGSIGKSGQISQVGEHIKALDGLLEKFSGLTSKMNIFGK